MSKYLMFIDDADDAACYPVERLISMTCASNATLLLNFESSVGKSDGGDTVTLTITADKEKSVMENIIKAINNAKEGDIITVANDTTVAATGLIEIVDHDGAGGTDINNLHGTNGFVLISTDGTSKEYIFDKNNALGATGTADAQGIVIQVNGMTTASDVANQVELAIEHSNGHNGKILVTRNNEFINLTQNTAGSAGNRYTHGGSLADNINITFTDMHGGTDGTYIDADITACAITLDT